MRLGDTSTIDSGSAYEYSFGLYPNKTTYYDPMGFKGAKTDQRNTKSGVLGRALMKGMKSAFTTGLGGQGTTDRVMVPIYVDERIIDIERKFTPLVSLFPRVTNMGLTADYNRVTDKGSGFVAGEDEPLTASAPQVERESKRIKYLYAVGRVTGQSQQAVPSFMLQGFEPTAGAFFGDNWGDVGVENAMRTQVVLLSRELKEFEENLIINGDEDSNPKEFDGIVKQQAGVNEIDKSGDELEYDDIETAITNAFKNGGRPTIGIGSPSAVQRVRELLRQDFYFAPYGTEGQLNQIDYGVPNFINLNTQVGRVALYPSMFLDDTSDNRSIYFLDMSHIEMRNLLDMTYEPLAKVNDSDKFMLKIYECLVMKAPEFNSAIVNID